ncbi:MAG: transketolase [Muribaculaceae bacterium]|nr:transketolase [Muribaculaceae bacterium]
MTGADNIRMLVAAMVEQAKSGHPGGAMGGADFVNVLFSRFLVYDPADPEWMGRDRFFLDPGHMSTMLYAVLALTGKYTVDELRQFRQFGSPVPGHPELDVRRGVENSSGPLGQGHAMAVGCAIAERILAARFGEVVAHKTYAYISDGGVQEEISQGAGRIAGNLGLHNLIMFYDANDVQLSTKVSEVTREDTAAKYRSWGWNVLEIDGSDEAQIVDALTKANAEKERPTLIIGHTVMARKVVKADGSSLEGAVSTHGQPLSKAGADIEATIRALGGDPENPWQIAAEVKEEYARRKVELAQIVEARKKEYVQWALANPEKRDILGEYFNASLPELDWSKVEFKPGMATRNASAAILGFLARNVPNMIVSSADLANSDKTDGFLKYTKALTASDFTGGFLQAGVAELTMAALMNGIALHGGLIAACGTFFVFSDYVKPALRMSALMELPVKFIFTHDSFRVGEDGPTHQPVEHEAQIRLMEELRNLSGKRSAVVFRPADANETLGAYEVAMATADRPSVFILSRQDLRDVDTLSRDEVVAGVKRGGYIAYGKAGEKPDVVLVGNGSDVGNLLWCAEALAAKGVRARVVSVPSIGLLLDQGYDYLRSLIPDDVKSFGLTSGLPSVLRPVMSRDCEVVGLDHFGASAPYKVLEHEFGFENEEILRKIQLFLC